MAGTISRRKALMTGALSTGLLYGGSSSTAHADELPDVWGEDFLTQWSPPANVKRDLKPGPTPVRLSCSAYNLNLTPPRGETAVAPIAEQVAAVRTGGYTACESGSLNWMDMPDSEVRSLKAALKQHDVLFYALHQWQNIIDPDTERADRNIRNIIMGVESAERIGVDFVVMHTGGRNPRSKDRPHKDNWTQETWDMGLAAIRRILKETSGSKVQLAFEAVNCCNNNTPQSHVRLMNDIGDPRIKVLFDPVNMIHPGVYFRTTELLNLSFDLLGENILACHAKDALWDSMSTAINEGQVLGTGCMDYAQYLVRMSQMKYPRALLIEHMPAEKYPLCKKHIVDTAAEVGVKIYS